MRLEESLRNIQQTGQTVPEFLRDWMCENRFLTKKLKQMTGNAAITHLSSEWGQPNWWEQHVPGLSGDKVYRRQVLIHSAEIPCWYARTIIPASTFYTFTDIFMRLKTQSLGDILFSESKIKRIKTLPYTIDPSCIEYHWPDPNLSREAAQLWVKLSQFSIDHKLEFYLTEIFLPEFEICLQQNGAATGA